MGMGIEEAQCLKSYRMATVLICSDTRIGNSFGFPGRLSTVSLPLRCLTFN